jgi:hypothetical protein
MNQWNFLFCLSAPKKDFLIAEEYHPTDNWTKELVWSVNSITEMSQEGSRRWNGKI